MGEPTDVNREEMAECLELAKQLIEAVRNDEPSPLLDVEVDMYDTMVFRMARTLVHTRSALDKLLSLSYHYAITLNQHDGGKRDLPASADDWISRCRETEW